MKSKEFSAQTMIAEMRRGECSYCCERFKNSAKTAKCPNCKLPNPDYAGRSWVHKRGEKKLY